RQIGREETGHAFDCGDPVGGIGFLVVEDLVDARNDRRERREPAEPGTVDQHLQKGGGRHRTELFLIHRALMIEDGLVQRQQRSPNVRQELSALLVVHGAAPSECLARSSRAIGSCPWGDAAMVTHQSNSVWTSREAGSGVYVALAGGASLTANFF